MDNFEERQRKLAVIVGGGPAPGINSVISSVVIEAEQRGFAQVIGFIEGFEHLKEGRPDPHTVLTTEDVSRITTTGGSYLRTSRANPTKSPKAQEMLNNVVRVFQVMGITDRVTIGGDDTAYSAMRVAEHAKSIGYDLRSVHVPKTIDNDLPLPEGINTFGYETARAFGTEIVEILAEDARTTGRWFVVVCMGRHAGHLALGIGKSAAATVTLIPEEFNMHCTDKLLVDIIVGAILKRLSLGKNYGLALVAEGFLELDGFFEGIDNVPRDDHGNVMMSEVDFDGHLKERIQNRLKNFGIKMGLVAKDLGYELRCAVPISMDIEYTRNLGWAAVDFISKGGTMAMISIQHGKTVPMYFKDIFDPDTGRVKVRLVDTESAFFRVGREYMVRLEPKDFMDEKRLARIAKAARVSPEKFKEEFEYTVQSGIPALTC